MSVDTLRLGTRVDIEPEGLRQRGWTVTTVQGSDSESRVSARLTLGNGARADITRHSSGVRWAWVEASLPKVVKRNNAVVLDWPDVELGARAMVAEFESAAGEILPPVGEWAVSRIDACFAWPGVPDAYIDALALGAIPRCSMASYGSGRRWSYPAGGVYGRVYDKAREQGRAVDLPLRIERQARPKKNKATVNGVEVPRRWAAWSEGLVLGLVSELVATLGLSGPVRTPAAVRAHLVAFHGQRTGENVYRAFLAAREAGGWEAVGGSEASKRRSRRLARLAGVVTLSDIELAPLEVPEIARAF